VTPITGTITFLPCLDLDAVHRFYTELLGLPLAQEQHTCRLYRAAPNTYVGFCSHTGTVPQPPESVIVTLLTDDVPAWHDHLTAQGVRTDGPARINERFQIEHFFAFDPSGYRIEIQRFLDPNWDISS